MCASDISLISENTTTGWTKHAKDMFSFLLWNEPSNIDPEFTYKSC